MSQFTFGNIDETETDGFDLAAFLESFEAAVNSKNSGNTAPVYAIYGTDWIDTLAAPNLWKVWDGTNWIAIGEFDTTTHTFVPYSNGVAMSILSTLGIGEGLESSSGTLRAKLDGSTLTRGAAGIKVNAKGIGNAQLADGTAGALRVYTAAGVSTDLVPAASAGKILKSGAANQPPSWGDPTPSGLEFIGEVNMGGVATGYIGFTHADYAELVLYFSNLSLAVSGRTLMIRPYVNGSLVNWTVSSCVALDGTTQANFGKLDDESRWGVSGSLVLPGYAGNTYRHAFGVRNNLSFLCAYYGSTGQYTGIHISNSNGNLFNVGGYAQLYGLKRS